MRATGKWHLAVLAALCSCRVARSGDGKEIDSAWLAKARVEVRTIYEKYKDLSARLEEESEYRVDKVPGSVGTMPLLAHSRRERVVRLGDNMILEQVRILDSKPKKPQIRLQCDNNDYHFTLGKSQEEEPYVLIEYKRGKRKYPLLQQKPGLHNIVFSYLRDILAAIDNDGKSTLRRLRFETTKGLLLVEYTHPVGDAPAQDKIYVDPSHDWRVVERRNETVSAVGTERWRYGVTVRGLEFPAELKALTIFKVAKAPPNMEMTGRLISLKITDKEPEAFRLSAFDLPEPIDVAPLPKPTRWYLWILAAAVAAATLAMLFAWLKRRHMKANNLSKDS